LFRVEGGDRGAFFFQVAHAELVDEFESAFCESDECAAPVVRVRDSLDEAELFEAADSLGDGGGRHHAGALQLAWAEPVGVAGAT
jgi:hypothetical protein